MRVVRGSKVLFQLQVDGPATAVARCSRAPSGAGASGDIDQQVLYGTENGLVGLAVYDGAGLKGGWVIDPVDEGRRGKSGGVLCVRAADLTKSGGCNILVGRDDGLVEVWSLEGEGTPRVRTSLSPPPT